MDIVPQYPKKGNEMKKYAINRRIYYDGKAYWIHADSEKDFAVKKAMKIRDLEEGKVTISKNMTVKQWADICLQTYRKPSVKDNTYEKYESLVKNCITDIIGTMQIKNVRHTTCQMVLNQQAGNSEYQIRQTKQFLHFIFQEAVAEKLILENPAARLKEPNGTVSERRGLTDAERKVFLEVTENNRRFDVFLLMYYCSCRSEEAREVMGKDIFWENNYPMLHIRGTKNKNADRVVPIPYNFYQRIKDTPKFSYVATNMAGNKYNKKSFYRAWQNLEREMNIAMGCRMYRNELIPPFPLAEDLVPYCLRHTYCTDLWKKGVDVRTAQLLMGHANIQITANIYSHADGQTRSIAAEILCNMPEDGCTPGATLREIK